MVLVSLALPMFVIFFLESLTLSVDGFSFLTLKTIQRTNYFSIKHHKRINFLHHSQYLSPPIFEPQTKLASTINTVESIPIVNRDVPEKVRVSAYLEIKKLKSEGHPIPDSLIQATGRPTLQDVESDLETVAMQMQQKELNRQAQLAAQSPEERAYEQMAIAFLSQSSLKFDISPEALQSYEEQCLFADLHKLPAKMVENKRRMKLALEKYRRHDGDVGSPEVQIARWTERIKYMTEHMLQNRKDFSSQRGLTQMVHDRRKMLNYLYRQFPERAIQIVGELGIRFKPPGKFLDKATKYEAFRNTKSKVAQRLKEQRESRKIAGLGPRRSSTNSKQLALNIEGLPKYTKLY